MRAPKQSGLGWGEQLGGHLFGSLGAQKSQTACFQAILALWEEYTLWEFGVFQVPKYVLPSDLGFDGGSIWEYLFSALKYQNVYSRAIWALMGGASRSTHFGSFGP